MTHWCGLKHNTFLGKVTALRNLVGLARAVRTQIGNTNNVGCADENNLIEIEEVEIEEKQQQSAENVPSCNYCAATIVARPLRTTVKGKKSALRVIVNSNLRSLIHWIQDPEGSRDGKLLLTHMNF